MLFLFCQLYIAEHARTRKNKGKQERTLANMRRQPIYKQETQVKANCTENNGHCSEDMKQSSANMKQSSGNLKQSSGDMRKSS